MLVTRAIVYLPGVDYERADRCIDYVRACGYKFLGLVRDWTAAQQMMLDDECSVAIVAEPGDLDPDRKPRIEFVSHPPKPATNGGRHWDERTTVIPRNAIE
jgi:hypothetical protein